MYWEPLSTTKGLFELLSREKNIFSTNNFVGKKGQHTESVGALFNPEGGTSCFEDIKDQQVASWHYFAAFSPSPLPEKKGSCLFFFILALCCEGTVGYYFP